MSEAQPANDREPELAEWGPGPEPPNGALYERRGGEGFLTLRGEVDIFEAQTVHAAALRCLGDAEAAATVDLMGVRRLDVSALQILVALRRDLGPAGRTASFQLPELLAAAVTRTGLCL